MMSKSRCELFTYLRGTRSVSKIFLKLVDYVEKYRFRCTRLEYYVVKDQYTLSLSL